MVNKNNLQETDPVFSFAVSPEFSKDQTVFAARGSGLYHSQDGGKTWQFSLESLGLETPLAISCVAVSPNFTEMPHVFAAGPGGVLCSRDGGQSWYVTMLPSPPPFVTALAVSPNYAKDGIVFACTMDDGVFRSSNRGVDWTAWNFGLFDLHVLSITVSPNFADDKNVYIGTESGIFRSVNGGLGWRELDFKVENAPVVSLAIPPNIGESQLLFAGSEERGVFYSVDRGTVWRLAEDAKLVGSVNSILLSDDNPEELCITIANEDSIIVSRNSGQTWQPWSLDLHFDDQILTVAAPKSVCPGSQLLVGLADGQIVNIKD
ncbi:MAG: hypothetical protein ABFS03_05570 [Chloroflexota bacterium]